MRVLPFLLFLILAPIFTYAQAISPEYQIKTAVLAAPEDMQADATVMGYDPNGKLVVLRKGSNQLTCIADDPESDGINIACYHSDLEPFMTRGRELRAEGMGRMEIFQQREDEISAGTLPMPEKATTLHIYYGPQEILNTETGEITGGKIRWVVYIPYATAESTGLPLKPAGPGMPWLMDPGTHRAHIMITPQN